MDIKGVTQPYSYDSFERQKKLLQEQLKYIGVNVSEEEAARISLLSRRKYERYDLFNPGESFDNRLINWLEYNFEKEDRRIAFEVIKCLKFISDYELKELAIQTFENAKNCIMSEINHLQNESCFAYFEEEEIRLNEELKNSLFVACADDIDFDFFRRYAMGYNPDIFIKENFIEYYKIDNNSLENEIPKFKRIFLLNQLSGSGTKAIRYKKNEKKWKGKIPTFLEIWNKKINDKTLYYTPYLLSSISYNNLKQRKAIFSKSHKNISIKINPTCIVYISPCLSDTTSKKIDENKPVAKLCKKYYNRFIPDKHIEEGGSACYGFGGAGLTLILQKNCPNNSIPIIWHNFNDWYPLFPRIIHHRG